jgi:hypothetical protein
MQSRGGKFKKAVASGKRGMLNLKKKSKRGMQGSSTNAPAQARN